ncbi:MAG: hypothetical protein IJL80_10845 [Treponema sp.]|nr:hypothetical protein [Treponema sp.]
MFLKFVQDGGIGVVAPEGHQLPVLVFGIIVAGRLSGVVHAGGLMPVREDVFVWAGCFETPQVRIANKLCFADPKSTASWRKSVLITLEEGTPVIRENKFLQSARKTEGSTLTGGMNN